MSDPKLNAQFEIKALIGVPEAAAILGLDEKTIRKALEAREIPGTRFGRVWRIPRWWIDQMNGETSSVAARSPNQKAPNQELSRSTIRELPPFGDSKKPTEIVDQSLLPPDDHPLIEKLHFFCVSEDTIQRVRMEMADPDRMKASAQKMVHGLIQNMLDEGEHPTLREMLVRNGKIKEFKAEPDK